MKSSWLTKGKLAAFHIFYQMVTQIFSLWFRFLSSHFSAFRCCLLLFFSSLFAFYKQFICGGSKIYFIMYAKCEKNTFAENLRFFVWATQPSRRAEKHIKNMHKAPSTDKRNVRFFPAVFIVMLQVLVEYPTIRCIYTFIHQTSENSHWNYYTVRFIQTQCNYKCGIRWCNRLHFVFATRVAVSQPLFLRVKNWNVLRCQWNLAFEWNNSNFPSTEFVLLGFSKYFFPKPTRLASWTAEILQNLLFSILK